MADDGVGVWDVPVLSPTFNQEGSVKGGDDILKAAGPRAPNAPVLSLRLTKCLCVVFADLTTCDY